MKKVNINPLSVNKAWKGRRFKTDDYHSYERELLFILPSLTVPKGFLSIFIVFGFSSKLKDIDNPLKLFIDVLQKKYKFNDRDIYKLTVEKRIVKKKEEYILFKINEL